MNWLIARDWRSQRQDKPVEVQGGFPGAPGDVDQGQRPLVHGVHLAAAVDSGRDGALGVGFTKASLRSGAACWRQAVVCRERRRPRNGHATANGARQRHRVVRQTMAVQVAPHERHRQNRHVQVWHVDHHEVVAVQLMVHGRLGRRQRHGVHRVAAVLLVFMVDHGELLLTQRTLPFHLHTSRASVYFELVSLSHVSKKKLNLLWFLR
jgi:hypothetical protein